MLAGVVYCTRVLAVEKLLPAAQRDEQTEAEHDEFLDMRKKYQVLYVMLDKQTLLVVVLLIGGGKSLLFTLPACVEETGVMVVFVTYWALIVDLVGRLRGYGVDCIEWTRGESNPASVVIVSADRSGDDRSNGNFL